MIVTQKPETKGVERRREETGGGARRRSQEAQEESFDPDPTPLVSSCLSLPVEDYFRLSTTRQSSTALNSVKRPISSRSVHSTKIQPVER